MSGLFNDIAKRIEAAMPAHRLPANAYIAATEAVMKLFQTAEPSDGLKPLDISSELQAAAKCLRENAETELQDWSDEHGPVEPNQERADRLGFLANVVQSVSEMIENPAKIIADLILDRDRWQQAHKDQAEQLAVTEAALHLSQESNVSLAQGQSELIELLEGVARYYASKENGPQPPVEPTADNLAMHINSYIDLKGYTYRVAVDIQRVLNAHGTPPPNLSEIVAKLREVTIIEHDESGRLVAHQPEPEKCPECGNDGASCRHNFGFAARAGRPPIE